MGDVIAIDIALEPDAAMMHRAEAANEVLRKNFPQGFALDDTHHAHITVLQCLSAPMPWTRFMRRWNVFWRGMPMRFGG